MLKFSTAMTTNAVPPPSSGSLTIDRLHEMIREAERKLPPLSDRMPDVMVVIPSMSDDDPEALNGYRSHDQSFDLVAFLCGPRTAIRVARYLRSYGYTLRRIGNRNSWQRRFAILPPFGTGL